MSQYSRVLRATDPKLVIGVGPAGTGKTMHACKQGLYNLKKGNVDKLIITRPTVSIDNEQMGFLPGSLKDKMDPWMYPIYDFFLEEIEKQDLQKLIEKQQLEICPLAYMRGRTFRKSYIIADEMQNASANQIKTLLTRLDENSKIVMTGDLDQCDIYESGLEDLLYRLEKCDNKNEYYHIEQFTIKDVKRSDFVKYILSMYSFKV